jgi:hypothetical protein
MRFDDGLVSPVQQAQVLDSQAYLLLYQLRPPQKAQGGRQQQ